MADVISAIVAVAECLPKCFKCLGQQASYISELDDNLKNLTAALDDLRAESDDVKRKVDDAELKGQLQLAEVKRWCSKVQKLETDTARLVAKASAVQQRRSTCGFCSMNPISTYRCGKAIPKMLSQVKNLKSEAGFQEVAVAAPPPVVVEEAVQVTFGLDTKLDDTWSRLMNDGTRMIGLHGMGGVGKSTLLNLIENKFVEVKNNYDVVILVKVSKDLDISKIQDEIGRRVGLYDENWSTKLQREKRVDIHRVLKKNKPRFVLLLDDLWEEVSLTAIGVPLQGKYKVVFTTRSKDVCRRMGANEDIEVECLAEKDALDLLKRNARREILNGEMLEHAKDIVRKCLGLPLALVVIGKSLITRTTADEWRDVLFNLEGNENEISPVLKHSYDVLRKKEEKLCLRYCALFPDGYRIRKDELVEYWIGEGFIDEDDGRDKAKIRGCEIIHTLVGASLLLEDGESKQKVYMHGMIREMALWIGKFVECGEIFVVKTGAGLSKLPKVKNWKPVTKLSLMNNEIECIPDSPLLPNPDRLGTLFLQNNKLVDIVGRFFQVLSTLVVLDLSHNPGITELPEDISILVALRYLSLSGTWIKDLPCGLKDLIQLIHLDLESTSNLQSLGAISGLINLQVLRFYGSAAALDLSLLKDLEGLEYLKLLTITVREVDVLEGFLASDLAGKTHGLYLEGIEVSEKSFAATFGELGSLSKLEMTECDIIESATEWVDKRRNQHCPSTSSNPITPSNTWFKNLSAVMLLSCIDLKDVTWLIYAANLESLSIKTSLIMEDVISQTKAEGVNVVEPFRNLQVLDLGYLGELKSIYWTSLSFPKLKKVNITECPKLRKLPLNSTSVDRIDDLCIEVDEEWLDGVEWESGAEERFRDVIHPTSVS